MDRDRDCYKQENDEMFHDHEVQGSTLIAFEDDYNEGEEERRDDCYEVERRRYEDRRGEQRHEPHNHRFATVSSRAICKDDSHFHEVEMRTDFFEDHFHRIRVITGLAIHVGHGRHVHFAKSVTSYDDGHRHKFRVASEIDCPIGEKGKH